MYITYPTHGAGARPSRTQAPTATRLTTPNAHQCVHQPREGRGRNRQTPPPKKRGGRARDRPTATKPPTHTTRGGQTLQPDGTEDSRHGAPRRNTGVPPSQNRRHPTESSGPPGERTPRTRQQTPRGGRDGQKKAKKNTKAQPEREGKGGRRPRDPRPGQPATDTTKPRHDRAKNHTPPRSPRKKNKRGGGGETPPGATPAHPNATGGPPVR